MSLHLRLEGAGNAAQPFLVFTVDLCVQPKGDIDGPCIMISSYTMISYGGKNRAKDSENVMHYIRNHEWGLLVLDEVHVAPAKHFRLVVHGYERALSVSYETPYPAKCAKRRRHTAPLGSQLLWFVRMILLRICFRN